MKTEVFIMHETIREELKQFNTVIKEIDAAYGEMAKDSGLTDSAFWALYYLAQMEGSRTQKAICDQWALSKQTVNNAVRDLEKSGYIYLTESAIDKRSKQILLTEKGQCFSDEHIGRIFRIEEAVFAGMTSAERLSLVTINQKYLKLLHQEMKK